MSAFADYEGDVPGAAVLVIRDGVVVTRSACGYADLEARVPVTPATNFRLASITKQFTAAAILELGLAHDPSIQQLLTHTSGLIDYEDVLDSDWQVDDRDVPRLIEGHPRYFAPGTSYRYSNTGYALLALIIERESGMSFADFLRTRIFEPLGMQATTVGPATNRAYGYSLVNGLWTRTDQDRTSATRGDGGIYSSIDDLAKWLAALDRGLYAEAMIPRTQTDDPQTQYGYGWRITGDTIWFRRVDRLPRRARARAAYAQCGRAPHEPQRAGAVRARQTNTRAD